MRFHEKKRPKTIIKTSISSEIESYVLKKFETKYSAAFKQWKTIKAQAKPLASKYSTRDLASDLYDLISSLELRERAEIREFLAGAYNLHSRKGANKYLVFVGAAVGIELKQQRAIAKLIQLALRKKLPRRDFRAQLDDLGFTKFEQKYKQATGAGG